MPDVPKFHSLKPQLHPRLPFTAHLPNNRDSGGQGACFECGKRHGGAAQGRAFGSWQGS